MERINFSNLPSTTTPINATNLNQLQTNVENGILDSAIAIYNNTNQIDPNTTIEPLILTRHANGPTANATYYIETFFYNSRSANNNRKQQAYGYNTNLQYQRNYINGTWSEWEKIVRIDSGLWTPALDTVEGVPPTYTTVSGGSKGAYKKMDSMVFISFYLRGSITALNGTNNFAAISGLPFAPKAVQPGENVISLGTQYNCINGDPSNRWGFKFT